MPEFKRLSLLSAVVALCAGSTCPFNFTPPTVDLADLTFTTFEYRLTSTSSWDGSPPIQDGTSDDDDPCYVDAGTLQNVTITQQDDGLRFEVSIVEEANRDNDICDNVLSSPEECRVSSQVVSRLLTQEEINLVAYVVSRIQTADEEPQLLPPGTMTGCAEIVPCYAPTYHRDDEAFWGYACFNPSDYPLASQGTNERIAEMIDTLRNP